MYFLVELTKLSIWRRANARNVSFILITVANLHFQLSWYNQITLLPPPTQHHSFFRNFHPLYENMVITVRCDCLCKECLLETLQWYQQG